MNCTRCNYDLGFKDRLCPTCGLENELPTPKLELNLRPAKRGNSISSVLGGIIVVISLAGLIYSQANSSQTGSSAPIDSLRIFFISVFSILGVLVGAVFLIAGMVASRKK